MHSCRAVLTVHMLLVRQIKHLRHATTCYCMAHHHSMKVGQQTSIDNVAQQCREEYIS